MKINQNHRFNIDLYRYAMRLQDHADAGEWKAYWKLTRCTLSAVFANAASDYAYRRKVKAHRSIKKYNDEVAVIEFNKSVEAFSNKI